MMVTLISQNYSITASWVMIINSETLKQSILSSLADKEMRTILDSIMIHPKSIRDIIKETGIPHTTAYRKIKSMLSDRVIVVERIEITPDGKKYSMLRSALRSITVKYDIGQIFVEAEENISSMSKAAEEFFSLE